MDGMWQLQGSGTSTSQILTAGRSRRPGEKLDLLGQHPHWSSKECELGSHNCSSGRQLYLGQMLSNFSTWPLWGNA